MINSLTNVKKIQESRILAYQLDEWSSQEAWGIVALSSHSDQDQTVSSPLSQNSATLKIIERKTIDHSL